MVECENEGCESDATKKVNWPGHGFINYCDTHAEKAQAIGGALGMGLGRGP